MDTVQDYFWASTRQVGCQVVLRRMHCNTDDSLQVNCIFKFLGLFPGVTQSSKMSRTAPKKEALQNCTALHFNRKLEIISGRHFSQSSKMSVVAEQETRHLVQCD